jgi:peptidoglycan pentaglycine glycine transferase (the first glycine)
MHIVPLSDWNQFLVFQPNAHLLQTGEWGELKSAFGWKAARIIKGNVGVQILFRKLPLGFTIGYLPKPTFSNQLPFLDQELWREIDAVCKKNRAIFLKIEPDLWQDIELNDLPITNYQLQMSPHNIQPPRTIIVDIKDSEEEILARMKQKTRYNIRLAEKKGVTVRSWDDIEAFHDASYRRTRWIRRSLTRILSARL